ncbi:hypothetical protein DL96DRAFT_1631441 [Flagelloscypha sp. PMI_526]|nr:hypothetical protein DL96DRAFT_1631441 [Flagelloscypha sp. PMI_526]
MASEIIPQELVRLIFSFTNAPTLASVCLSNRLFYLDATLALYQNISFAATHSVEHFVLCARNRLNLVKHLSLSIPTNSDRELEIWEQFLIAVKRDSSLISLRITSPIHHGSASIEVQHLAGELLSIPSLKYVSVALSVVSATAAVQCRVLREIEIRESVAWDEREISKYTQEERPKLNGLGLEGPDRSPQLLGTLFHLNGLTRLAISYPSHVMEIPCRTLRELSIWMPGDAGETYITELSKLSLPGLQSFTLLCFGGAEISQRMEVCNLLLSTLISVSGKQFEDFRLYLHDCDPSIILNEEKSSIPCFHPQIKTLRLYCWDSDDAPQRVPEAEEILHERMGAGRDFQVVWSMSWTSLTCFGYLESLGRVK